MGVRLGVNYRARCRSTRSEAYQVWFLVALTGPFVYSSLDSLHDMASVAEDCPRIHYRYVMSQLVSSGARVHKAIQQVSKG